LKAEREESEARAIKERQEILAKREKEHAAFLAAAEE